MQYKSRGAQKAICCVCCLIWQRTPPVNSRISFIPHFIHPCTKHFVSNNEALQICQLPFTENAPCLGVTSSYHSFTSRTSFASPFSPHTTHKVPLSLHIWEDFYSAAVRGDMQTQLVSGTIKLSVCKGIINSIIMVSIVCQNHFTLGPDQNTPILDMKTWAWTSWTPRTPLVQPWSTSNV